MTMPSYIYCPECRPGGPQYIFVNAFERNGILFESVTTVYLHRIVLKVTRTDCQSDRHALELPFCELEARPEGVTVVNLDRMSGSLKRRLDLVHLPNDGSMVLGRLVDRDHNHLNRSKCRREDESVVIAVCHDERTHQTCGHTP